MRAPIVTVLGHVDHGKTSLLDALRKSNVAEKEIGGITQSIGASQITTKATGPVTDSEESLTRRDGLRPGGKKITFIDTPGHAAFSKMRSRGAKVADIAILVVSADDGVKPQTKEALSFILEEKIPYIVAITKIDLQSADIEGAKRSLADIGVLFEGGGGNIPVVPLSARTKKGLDELLEVIILVSEVEDIKGDSAGELEAFVVETKKDKRGTLVSVIVRNGSIKVGDQILVDGVLSKVRGIFDSQNKSLREVGPGEPALILGFEKMPPVGSPIKHWKGEVISVKNPARLHIKDEGTKEMPNIIIKAQSSGVLEAISENLPVGVNIVGTGIGDVNESDIFSAKAGNAKIFVFEAKVPVGVARLAEMEGVKIETFNIIYRLFERIEELNSKKEKVVGKAEIIAVFPYENKKVAGGKVILGKLNRQDQIKILRGEKEIGEVKIISMKKEKKDISQASAGEEFGVIFEPQLAFTIGDVLVSVAK
ncbi:hypothetical protein A3A76_05030 [Candidatus Woesebacteria bacterium RIFCSPLOWO2_01_FULL_39_23]|nr:MAG: hypothetical protein A2141_04255 [Candidatus Woesebacteria bacterium RBG_16_40_11]OGM27797.1 MAG: hypothetical protein A2628_05250 [Candidatus Woesebacteria bacterium RIFCSPHIGHO2_01_FULL_40_22]OGM36091.1 MAG: hypothetical protein A3E41_04655 [Candidatus Woesebacteria bacterium RIFCSPHIGHO2_12_FULL_38_9]OGM62219.1 MAG: hypothetical protein A3A76_05030 [Candidatus Woesebacteria bacterium RIFCSPLOWO2_01_FULL_39_23]